MMTDIYDPGCRREKLIAQTYEETSVNIGQYNGLGAIFATMKGRRIEFPVPEWFKSPRIPKDQVIISNSEDNLQRGLYTLNKILSDFGMEI
ncbi:hypothetical protein ANN_06331 [Periplaneta americana]|uniref:Per a allergen n=1 Tax=Periplaneta americana TaxID=6978 RepID=A0ABQ8TD93_PERAM|nr:hypothetical protein ANN_06331 [Periplaneta americana]